MRPRAGGFSRSGPRRIRSPSGVGLLGRPIACPWSDLAAGSLPEISEPLDYSAPVTPTTPPDPPLTETARRVLEFLMRHPRPAVTDRTTAAIGDELGIGQREAQEALHDLEQHEPQLARSLVDEGLDIQFWVSSSDAADAVD